MGSVNTMTDGGMHGFKPYALSSTLYACLHSSIPPVTVSRCLLWIHTDTYTVIVVEITGTLVAISFAGWHTVRLAQSCACMVTITGRGHTTTRLRRTFSTIC